MGRLELAEPCPPKHREFGSHVLGSGCFAFQICSCRGAQLVRVDAVTYHVPHDPSTKQTVTAASAASPHVCCTSVQ